MNTRFFRSGRTATDDDSAWTKTEAARSRAEAGCRLLPAGDSS